MLQAWRIVKQKHAATAFSGEGAARTGGRWNSRGGRVVYASGSQALAALESLVHLNPPALFAYVTFGASFNRAFCETLPQRALPPNWRLAPAPPSCQALGDAWLHEERSAVLEVPSVIVEGESNYLLNPAHPDFKNIVISPPRQFSFDPRLLR